MLTYIILTKTKKKNLKREKKKKQPMLTTQECTKHVVWTANQMYSTNRNTYGNASSSFAHRVCAEYKVCGVKEYNKKIWFNMQLTLLWTWSLVPFCSPSKHIYCKQHTNRIAHLLIVNKLSHSKMNTISTVIQYTAECTYEDASKAWKNYTNCHFDSNFCSLFDLPHDHHISSRSCWCCSSH